MVLIVMFLFFTVYMNMLSRDKDYQDAVIRSNQMDINKATEQESAYVSTLRNEQVGGAWFLKCYVSNTGSTPLRIVRVWTTNCPSQGQTGYVSFSTPLTIAPGETNREILGTRVSINPNVANNFYYLVNVVTTQGNLLAASVLAQPS